ELERLRRENELLKLNLEVVLEKVRAQEAELRTLKVQPPRAAAFAFSPDGKKITTATADVDIVIQKVQPQALQFEWKLEKPRNKEELQRAIDELDKALKGLRDQLRKEAAPKKGNTKEHLDREQSELH